MCGVFALFLNRPLVDADNELGRAGSLALAHRGPDAEGEWIDREKGVYLGHRRLTVIDLSDASNQPMERDNIVVSYNGEVYNYRSLRERLLGLGSKFSTTGDVEVLLRAWQQFGTRSLDLFDGMFAFAIWNGTKGYLASDSFGEKTLYYAETSDGIYVSSELPPLVRLIDARSANPPAQLTPFLALGYVPAPDTIYPSIKRLLPASYIEIQDGKLGVARQYWTPPIPEMGKGPLAPLSENDLDRVQEKLIESVANRLESDVPMCTFLSGGLDSVLVAAIAAKELGNRSMCLTVGFPQGRIHDESEDARAIADYLQLDHMVVNSKDDSGDVNCRYIFEMYGQPNENIAIASMHQISQVAAEQNFRVALTGMGGDELALGYQKHNFTYRNRKRYTMPETLRLACSALLLPVQSFNDKFRLFRDVFGVRDSELYLALKNLPMIHFLRQLPNFEQWADDAFGSYRGSFANTVQPIDLATTLPNSLLTSSDLASMRASLELRTPYLSRSLFELFATFDSRALLAFGQKSSLRRIAGRYIPADYIDRPKRGFAFPQDRFLRHYKCAPKIDGIRGNLSDEAWRRRDEPGWRRLAVRMVVASEFADWLGTNGRGASQ